LLTGIFHHLKWEYSTGVSAGWVSNKIISLTLKLSLPKFDPDYFVAQTIPSEQQNNPDQNVSLFFHLFSSTSTKHECTAASQTPTKKKKKRSSLASKEKEIKYEKMD